jgi:hypothetical protein
LAVTYSKWFSRLPNWLQTILCRQPFWFPTNLSLALSLPIGRIEADRAASTEENTDWRQNRVLKMKFKLLIIPTLTLFGVSIPALAKKNPPRPFQLREAVILNGAQVPAGLYDLIWETQGAKARVTLQKDGKFIATAEGDFVKSGMKFVQDAAVLRENPDGTEALVEIRIAGSTKAIVLNSGDATIHYSVLKH